MTISQRIFETLSKRGLNQAQFSKDTGIHQGTISDWKIKGTNPSADKISVICEVLNVSTDWLLTGKESPGSYVSVNGSVSDGSVVQGINNGYFNANTNNSNLNLTDEQSDLLRIYNSLTSKERHTLLGVAYDLEEQSEKRLTK
jgi:transcriptional regulator with XRE-family HTH domain